MRRRVYDVNAASDLGIHCLPMPQSRLYCTDRPLYTGLWRHSDKNSNRYLDFVQTRDLISLVKDYQLDNSLKEIWLQV